jgi:hypothetical protein
MLLGVDVFVESLLIGRRMGPPDTPVAFETVFGWVLAGSVESTESKICVSSHHASVEDILRRFWEIEDAPLTDSTQSLEERTILRHFHETCSRTPEGRFIVTLPKKPDAKAIGESRSLAIKRFLSVERSLKAKGIFHEVDKIMREYLELNHAEPIPFESADKPVESVFYLPMHIVYKECSTTTKIRPVFDASAKSSTGVSLNDTLLVGPTVHPTLVDVLLRFRLHRVALTTDVSKMYRAVQLSESDRDLHRFVWRSECSDIINDFRMTRVTFGVSASSFAANMSIKQNALEQAHLYPIAAKIVETSFYVDDGLTGADSTEEAISLHHQLQKLFDCGGFHLRKWNSSDPNVLKAIDPQLRDSSDTRNITDSTSNYTKTLGLKWNPEHYHFQFTFSQLSSVSIPSKRILISDVAKIFDVMGWFSPTVIKAKILLQRLWEAKLEWDEPVPSHILDVWVKWRSELPLLSEILIPRYYFSNDKHIVSVQIHGFSDASEDAYAAVVYARSIYSTGQIHTSIVTSKSRVAPIKRITIPRLELCGAHLLAKLLDHTKEIFNIPMHDTYAWTDSTIVLCWLKDTPRRFKTYVGNRVSSVTDRIPPERWRHVPSIDNPADAPSRGIFPSELVSLDLWWKGPAWLYEDEEAWPRSNLQLKCIDAESQELKVASHEATICSLQPVVSVDSFSDYTRLVRVIGWIRRFITNCCPKLRDAVLSNSCLTIDEYLNAERTLLLTSQQSQFPEEILSLRCQNELPRQSPLCSLRPFLDKYGLIRVGGRISKSNLPFSSRHPLILAGKDGLTKLIVRSEHTRLNHAGPTLLIASINRCYHVINLRKIARTITRQCIVCRRYSVKSESQLMGQLPAERVSPDSVFENVGVDYAGPVMIRYGYVRKPVLVKAYICVFVSLSVKAVHLELVTDLKTEAFIACLRRFISRRGHPNVIWSDNGTNFVGANRELQELSDFLERKVTQNHISQFCVARRIEWRFIPERSPHFGGLWEAAVKSMKTHLKRVISNVKLTYEEFYTILTQIEACLNSRPLTSLCSSDEGIEALTPGHFLVNKPIMALPDHSSTQSLSLLRRWKLCQALVSHFWKRWSTEYLVTLNKFSKWRTPKDNVNVGDVVVLREDNIVPSQWPLARIVEVHPGNDGLVRVVTLKTSKGIYKRPITKIATLLPADH